MKRNSIFLFILYCSLFLSSCNTTTPEKYFDVTVLNSNRVVGFAGTMISRQLESPSVTMDTNGQTVPMKRVDVIKDLVQFTEAMIDRISNLGKDEDSKEIVESSLAMYNYILPVYKNEYTQLAKLYDEGVAKEKTGALDNQIKEKYAPGFETLYKDLISKGKLYAAKHNIPVNWAD